MIVACLALMVISWIICFLICRQTLHTSKQRGLIDRPGTQAHNAHAHAVPNTGGKGIFWAIFLPAASLGIATWFIHPVAQASMFATMTQQINGFVSMSSTLVAVLCAIVVIHLLGRIDDRRHLEALPKLLVQCSVALVLAIWFDFRIFHFLEQWGIVGQLGSVILSVIWMLAIINSMNMLDNMDGLSAGVGAIIALFYFAATMYAGQWFVAGLTAMLLGSLLGFLCFNFPTAKMFMGDGGSLLLGLLLALISMRTTYIIMPLEHGPWLESARQMSAISPGIEAVSRASVVSGASGASGVGGQWHILLMPLMFLAVPLYDLVSVLGIRLSQGQKLMVGDRNHFSHRLVRQGLAPWQAVVTIWLATILTAAGGMMFLLMTPGQSTAILGFTCMAMAGIAWLECRAVAR